MSSLCHRSSSKGNRLGQQPYDKYKITRPSHRRSSASDPSPSSSATLSSSSSKPRTTARPRAPVRPRVSATPSSFSASQASSSPTRALSSFREVALQIIRKRYPSFKPRNDFDILTLSSGVYNGPEDGIEAWLDGELAVQLEIDGNIHECFAWAEKTLNYEGQITGIKPSPNDPGVFVRPIPRSSYSLRLFPGCPLKQEYCLDFVHTRTGQPVNSPFKFELLAASGGLAHTPSTRMISFERTWGIAQKDIVPGEEKFVLRDGMVCILRRPGRKDVRFTVPTRASSTSIPADAHELHFPRFV